MGSSLAAENSSALGTLRYDGAVYLDGAQAHSEATIYDGNRVNTASGHALLSLRPGIRAFVDKDSAASLNSQTNGPALKLEKGRQAWLENSARMQLQADGLNLTSHRSFPVLAEIALREDGSLVMAVHKGAISIGELRPEPVVVKAGKIITIAPRLRQTNEQQSQQSQPIGTGAHAKMGIGEKLRTFQIGDLSHTASAAIVFGAVGGAAATAIIVPLTVGTESSPAVP